MSVFVKICGIARMRDAELVARLKPDAIGFVFYPPSPRVVTAADAEAWSADLPEDITKVGVFVNEDIERVLRVQERVGLDVVQLHGSESPEYAEQIPVPVWKAVHLDHDSLEELSSYKVDAFIIDQYTKELPGGTGRTVDWAKAASFVEECQCDVLLAGGLSAGNVLKAISEVKPWGVDVSTGVEACPGEKDPDKVKAFIEKCRS